MAEYKDMTRYRELFDEEYKKIRELISQGETHLDNLAEGFTGADFVIRKMPVADVVEVRRGRWLPQRLLGADVVDCSECKTLGSPQWKWCPVCGADMRGNNNDNRAEN